MTLPRADEPHPDVQQFLEMYDSVDVPDFGEVSPETARQLFDQLRVGKEVVFDLHAVEDRTIDGPDGEIAIRYYEPRAGPGEEPLILYFHGGGWVIGSVETHDVTCRKLAAESGYAVVSVDYRPAPEHPFPAGLEDCYAALEWAGENAAELDADPDRIVLAGDSAGGNLATATALLARDRDGPRPAYQVLLYPSTGDVTETPAYEENAEGYVLTKDEIDWFVDHYLEDEIDRGNVYALPRRAHDLSGLPPATIVTAGFDPLRDDGGAYADRLEADGVSVSHHHYDDVVHGFVGMIGEPIDLERAHEAYDEVVTDLQTELE
ncbi:alpha/beta hydrolase [Natronobacterium gregoryi]|uniref:Alpha/beta hydrolase n=2 Tax=Natronobacterium gregoryi TaxID=44930 RepID=L0AKT0_NATGS|nr:alpha/beta hydrolase [Natronobacterium gregoryi]AFZ73630.1 esterase/lipase [Natronobacterium gregoryi SP2]ELY67913.1 alpha/beta hydrolase fold-3 protein domain-containing protein [Natronobacterium gregoryi SP2]PLK19981.1 alpha/beta hydrolase [Natronobacterium gregoryi SP2]SFJ33987.1 acetyl esterase [Natronobacterium gregoryi]